MSSTVVLNQKDAGSSTSKYETMGLLFCEFNLTANLANNGTVTLKTAQPITNKLTTIFSIVYRDIAAPNVTKHNGTLTVTLDPAGTDGEFTLTNATGAALNLGTKVVIGFLTRKGI